MPNEFAGEARLRLERFSGVLRRFGLVDRNEIGTRVSLAESLTLPTLRRLLAPFADALPKGVPVAFLAKSVQVALAEASPATLAWRERFAAIQPQLTGIGTGRKHASRYHKHVFTLLTAIFDGFLTDGKIEQEINTGIQRVDIMFDNTCGVFCKIAKSILKASPYIPFECKNYADDVGNPEYDQLSGRLNVDIGAVGVLVFRSILDWGRANAHCQARMKGEKYLILLDDSDLAAMYQNRYDGDIRSMEGVVTDRFRSLRLNVRAK